MELWAIEIYASFLTKDRVALQLWLSLVLLATLVSFVNVQVNDFNRFSLLITCCLFIQILLKFSKVTFSNLRQVTILQKYLGHTKVPTLPSIVELSTAESPIIPVNLSSNLLILWKHSSGGVL